MSQSKTVLLANNRISLSACLPDGFYFEVTDPSGMTLASVEMSRDGLSKLLDEMCDFIEGLEKIELSMMCPAGSA